MSGRDAQPSPGRPPIAPMYRRLPHGPHRLERDEVVRHQRARLYGAMIEAIALVGYERASVRQVIGLAGVSRRSFYEQFENKQDCFVGTFDMLASRGIRCMAQGYLADGGDLAGGLTAAFEALCSKIAQAPKAAHLVLVEAPVAGSAGIPRIHEALNACERLLVQAFERSPGGSPPPAPIARALAGALHGVLAHAVRSGEVDAGGTGLAAQMAKWTLGFHPRDAHLDGLLEAHLNRQMRQISLANAHPRREPAPPADDARARVLHEALRMVMRYDYRELSAPQIADEAQVHVDAFLEMYATREECYLAALDMLAEQLSQLVADPALDSEQWPSAVRAALARLLCHLGENPLHARTIGQAAFAAGSVPAARVLELVEEIAAALCAGAPAGAGRDTLAVQAVTGALLHTIRSMVISGRVQLLGALSEHLAYVVLTSCAGADATREQLCRGEAALS